MSSTLVHSFVFLLGLALGYCVNIFVTNKSFHDLVRENKSLQAQVESLQKSPGLDTATCVAGPDSSGAAAESTLPPGHGDQAVAVAPGTSTGSGASRDTAVVQRPAQSSDRQSSFRVDANQVETQGDLDRFLEERQRQNAFEALKKNQPLNENFARRLNGLYSGEIVFTQPKTPQDRKWEIEMVIEGEWDRDQFRGRDQVRLFRETKNFSDSTSGPNSTLGRYQMGSEGSLWVELKAQKSYLQLYYLPKLDRWVGHIYEQKSLDEFLHRGHVSMFRR